MKSLMKVINIWEKKYFQVPHNWLENWQRKIFMIYYGVMGNTLLLKLEEAVRTIVFKH